MVDRAVVGQQRRRLIPGRLGELQAWERPAVVQQWWWLIPGRWEEPQAWERPACGGTLAAAVVEQHGLVAGPFSVLGGWISCQAPRF